MTVRNAHEETDATGRDGTRRRQNNTALNGHGETGTVKTGQIKQTGLTQFESSSRERQHTADNASLGYFG